MKTARELRAVNRSAAWVWLALQEIQEQKGRVKFGVNLSRLCAATGIQKRLTVSKALKALSACEWIKLFRKRVVKGDREITRLVVRIAARKREDKSVKKKLEKPVYMNLYIEAEDRESFKELCDIHKLSSAEMFKLLIANHNKIQLSEAMAKLNTKEEPARLQEQPETKTETFPPGYDKPLTEEERIKRGPPRRPTEKPLSESKSI